MTQSAAFDIAVLGAGMAGVSAAAEMAPFARVLLIEGESQPGYHATGRSAAILAQTYGNDVVRALTRASSPFLTAPPEGFSDAPLLTPRGLIRIARADQVEALRAMFDDLEDTGFLEWVDAADIERLVPLLRPGYAAGGFLNAEAQDLDVHALLQGYLRRFRARGGTLVCNAPVQGLERDGAGWTIRAGGETYLAGQVVNATGAWADQTAEMAGGAGIGLQPLRRSALTFRPPSDVDVAAMPMVVDAAEEFYVKPEAGKLMASPANETPSDPCDSRPEEIEVAVAIDRVLKAFALDVKRIEAQWSGLRTFSPDRAPICGHDAELDGFFWLAAQGGYGIQTAPALARLTAHLVAGAPLDEELTKTGLSPDRLSPQRFQTGKTNEAVNTAR
ncbi:NAD(P)/FAD-dependent oxidoreductase [Pseudooceanicola sp.]|uniref:NAD(P)/FAD-dependent oxidoreductase n=1 Tax=Pseudooceanicola sp. TaxID=1914328 RepID=UPI0035C724B6